MALRVRVPSPSQILIIIMDWILMGLNLYSYYLISNKKSIGFIVGLIGCIVGIIFFRITSVSMIIMYITFGILNIRGYILWNQKN